MDTQREYSGSMIYKRNILLCGNTQQNSIKLWTLGYRAPDFPWTIHHDAGVGFRQTYVKFSSTAHELRLWPLSLNIALAQSFSCVWLFCDPMDCSPPGSSDHGISQARTLRELAGRFFITEPPGKPKYTYVKHTHTYNQTRKNTKHSFFFHLNISS